MTNRGECRQVIVKVDDKYGTNCNDQTRGGLPDGWTDILMAHNMSERQSIKTLLRFCDLMCPNNYFLLHFWAVISQKI